MNFKFRTKILFLFSIIIIFSIASVNLFIRMHIFRQIEDAAAYNDQQLCIKISENVDTYIEKLDDITKKLISDPALLRIMREAESGTGVMSDYDELQRSREIAGIVSNAITLTSFPHVNIYLFSINNSFSYTYNQNNSNFESIMSKKENVSKLERKKLVIFPDNKFPDTMAKEASISFMRAIFDVSANRYGYIEVQSDYMKLDEICHINHIGNVIVMDQKGGVVYPSIPIEDEIRQILNDKQIDDKTGYFKQNNNIYYYTESEYSGLTTFIQYPEDTINSSLKLLSQTTLIFFICITALAVIMVVIFTRMLVKPLQELRNSVLQVTYENMGLTIDNVYNNEIVELRDAFQTILSALKLTAQREIASNKAEARARLSALQSQISPHFVHNVLYSISIAAREERSEDAAAMCKQLSDMLRYTVNSDSHWVNLKEEMICISNYLAIQEKYYEEFLQYVIEVEKEAEVIKIPRLSILPFVENAIQHAFEGRRPPYIIEVSVKVNDGRWQIEIKDNGIGFPDSKIEELEKQIASENITVDFNKNQEEAPGMGVGIPNSILRLKIFFEKSFQFKIRTNIPNGGTIICLEGELEKDAAGK